MTTTAHRRILRDVLAWTQLQARILTANGRANAYFTDFKPEELPHHHLRRGTEPILTKTAPAWAVGCWARPLFSGGGAATSDDRVRNVQGLTHFVDVRMPAGRDAALRAVQGGIPSSMDDCSDDALRILARQHAFGGVGVFGEDFCARHHVVDWQFAPDCIAPRARPNKWRLVQQGPDEWVEEAFAGGYYYELWRRVGRRGGDALALRAIDERDALVVVAGGRFAYVVARATAPQALGEEYASNAAYVDAALAQQRRGDAEAMLGLEAGWGLAAGAWAVEAALQPWREGCALSEVVSGVAFRVVERGDGAVVSPPGVVVVD